MNDRRSMLGAAAASLGVAPLVALA